jgi:hypothetical protein
MKNKNVKRTAKAAPIAQSQNVEKILGGFSGAERENLKATLKKYCAGDAAQWEEKKLLAAGLIIRPAAADAGEDLSDCTSGAELSARLTRHFAGRIAIDISAPALAQWRRGRGLPPGTPLPPPRVNGRHKTVKWADWVEKHLLPKYGVSTTGAAGEKSIFEQAQIADAERKINEAALAEIERNVAEGKYQDAERFIKDVRFMATVSNNAITAAIERGVAEKLTALCYAWNITAEERAKFQQTVTEACQCAADYVRAECQRALNEASEKAE